MKKLNEVTPSLNLRIMRALKKRMALPQEAQRYHFNLESGHEGECNFSSMIRDLSSELIIAHDLLLKANGVKFQLDVVMMTPAGIRLYEVKNYE
ncbi:nuclease-related domain-containing protein [Atopococcus tabaci]|uniref:nuclease-related domain-containing protein n=1 Tax=Atopococcus tabaci TaxID=269774 RepID=UPI000407D96A|nr:nuclease-related domain-containing protein [Atopococcus tabaci]